MPKSDNAIRITIQTDPVPKGRPRVSFVNGKAHTFTPERTKKAQKGIVRRLKRYQGRCFAPHVPVMLSVTFFRVKSKWLPRKESLPVRKPDLDNFLKLLLDAMNGILVADDAQICTIIVKKRWSNDGNGHINIRMEKDDEN